MGDQAEREQIRSERDFSTLTIRLGLVEYAKDGTLILDEILNLPPHAQQLLLDFTQFGTYRPLGHTSPEPKQSRVRIIAATNGDLGAAIRDRRFREDLYYRLAAVTLELPPLRARREDIPAIAEQTLRRVDPARPWTLSLPLRRLLISAAIHWSGNVRQLERAVERARERAVARDPETSVLDAEYLEPRDLGSSTLESVTATAERDSLAVSWRKLQNQRSQIEEGEQDIIREALTRSGGIVTHAARELGIARTTLASRLEVLGIRKGKPTPPSTSS